MSPPDQISRVRFIFVNRHPTWAPGKVLPLLKIAEIVYFEQRLDGTNGGPWSRPLTGKTGVRVPDKRGRTMADYRGRCG